MNDDQIRAATYGHILGAMTALNVVPCWHIVVTLYARGGVWWAP